MYPKIETAKIITLSTVHLHPETIEMIEREKGDLPEGPSIAIRDEGFLVNSYLGSDDALTMDLEEGLFLSLHERAPDLVLLRALARGLGAGWINIDRDGEEYRDMLPSYGPGGALDLPEDPAWAEGLSQTVTLPTGAVIVSPEPAILSILETGQIPYTYLSREVLLDYPAYRQGKIRLAGAPSFDTRPSQAIEWVKAYGGMVSYESALDAAGYERESEMRNPDAPIRVDLAKIYHDGSMEILSFHHGKLTIPARDLCGDHGIDLQEGKDDVEEPDV